MISTDTIGRLGLSVLAAGLLGTLYGPTVAHAAGDAPEIARQAWSFSGIRGRFDQAQLQRGFKVYQEVCAACHGLKRVYFRNLSEPGGPEFPRDRVEQLARSWPNQIFDGPNDQGQIATSRGQLIKRPAKLSDPILGPYDNEQQARAAQNGALPPDLSLITKARSSGGGTNFINTFTSMLKDVPRGYQEGGADYVYGLLTGYANKPADLKLADGMHYNAAFPGHQIAMADPLLNARVRYEDGSPPASPTQYAKDVTAFLTWAGDPHLETRKSTGLMVALYLAITTILFFIAKRRLWSRVPH